MPTRPLTSRLRASLCSPVVTVTPTIMSGTVVRWYRNVRAAEDGREVLSASRDGVMVTGGHLLPAEWLTAATSAYEAMSRGQRDMSHLATHRRTKILGGDLEPITREDPQT